MLIILNWVQISGEAPGGQSVGGCFFMHEQKSSQTLKQHGLVYGAKQGAADDRDENMV